MKKFLLLLAVVSGAALFAAPQESDNYESLMLTIWEDAPEYQMTTPTYGVKIGILGCGGAPVYGAEGAVIAAGSDEVTGFKGSLAYTVGKKVNGVLTAPFNWIDEVNGLSVGIVNVAKKGGIQIGLLNFMDNGFLPFCLLVNFSL